jgi:hypothetical protein
MMGGFSSWFGGKKDPAPFFEQHISWMQKMKKPHPSFLKLDSFNWKNFVAWVKQEYDYNLYPSEEELNDLIRYKKQFLKEIENKRKIREQLETVDIGDL